MKDLLGGKLILDLGNKKLEDKLSEKVVDALKLEEETPTIVVDEEKEESRETLPIPDIEADIVAAANNGCESAQFYISDGYCRGEYAKDVFDENLFIHIKNYKPSQRTLTSLKKMVGKEEGDAAWYFLAGATHLLWGRSPTVNSVLYTFREYNLVLTEGYTSLKEMLNGLTFRKENEEDWFKLFLVYGYSSVIKGFYPQTSKLLRIANLHYSDLQEVVENLKNTYHRLINTN